MPFFSTTGTWGVFATNNRTWNWDGYPSTINFIEDERNPIVTASRAVNLVGGALGYTEGVNFYSGITRMVWGCGLIITSFRFKRVYTRGVFIGVCQIARGALEMLNMRMTNLVLDILFTLPNMSVHLLATTDNGGSRDVGERETLVGPTYPPYIAPLYLG